MSQGFIFHIKNCSFDSIRKCVGFWSNHARPFAKTLEQFNVTTETKKYLVYFKFSESFKSTFNSL